MAEKRWPLQYFIYLKKLYKKTGVYLFYDIDSDEILEEHEIENSDNYRLSRKNFLGGSRNSINKLYRKINNNKKIYELENYNFNMRKITEKYRKINIYNIVLDDVW